MKYTHYIDFDIIDNGNKAEKARQLCSSIIELKLNIDKSNGCVIDFFNDKNDCTKFYIVFDELKLSSLLQQDVDEYLTVLCNLVFYNANSFRFYAKFKCQDLYYDNFGNMNFGEVLFDDNNEQYFS